MLKSTITSDNNLTQLDKYDITDVWRPLPRIVNLSKTKGFVPTPKTKCEGVEMGQLFKNL